VKNLQERADGLFDALLVAPFDGLAESNALADLLIPVGVLELVVKSLRQVIGDEPVVVGQELAAVLGHLPTWDVRSKAVHHGQVELWRQGLKEIVLFEFTTCCTDTSMFQRSSGWHQR